MPDPRTEDIRRLISKDFLMLIETDKYHRHRGFRTDILEHLLSRIDELEEVIEKLKPIDHGSLSGTIEMRTKGKWKL